MPELPIPFEDRAFTVNESSALLRVSRGTTYKLIREGRLEVVKLGNRSVVTGRAIRKCLNDDAGWTSR
jgi:excisionase family DNA binding protein